MARIRTIKPEFWRSPDVMELDNFQKLLFIGLWNLADDEGRGVFSPEAIAADLFLTEYSLRPHGVLTDVSNAFLMYSELDMVQLYSVGRRKYFQVQNWGKHQKINRPTPSKFPAPDQGVCIVQCEVIEDALDTHGGLTEDSVRTHDRNREQGTGNREQILPQKNETTTRQTLRSGTRSTPGTSGKPTPSKPGRRRRRRSPATISTKPPTDGRKPTKPPARTRTTFLTQPPGYAAEAGTTNCQPQNYSQHEGRPPTLMTS